MEGKKGLKYHVRKWLDQRNIYDLTDKVIVGIAYWVALFAIFIFVVGLSLKAFILSVVTSVVIFFAVIGGIEFSAWNSERKVFTIIDFWWIAFAKKTEVDYESVEHYERMKEWCMMNCRGPYRNATGGTWAFLFGSDLVAFKLRWSESNE